MTRVAAYIIMGGVLLQAGIAGGFLAGHPWTDIHMFVGIPLLVSALALVGAGLYGRRVGAEPRSVLITRVAVLVALLTTAALGLIAGQGTRDLLVLHIPLAIISMGLSARLAGAVPVGKT